MDNTYDETTNTMSIGAIDGCLDTALPGNDSAHSHTVQLVIQDVEDLIGWQARLSYIGGQMRPASVNFTPFTDNNTGQNVSFLNLPIDAATILHRDLVAVADIPAPASGPQSALIGSVYYGPQTAAISPDSPAKAPPDDSSYTTSGGGVLASLNLQVAAGNAVNASLLLNLDDGAPSFPGSDLQIFTGTGIQTINLPVSRLGDGYHGEGVACLPLDCTTIDCATPSAPTTTATGTPAGPPTPTATPTSSPGPTPAPGPGSGGAFAPQLALTYSGTQPGSSPDIAGKFSLGLGADGSFETPDDTDDYGPAGTVSFLPTAPRDADVPDGAVLGTQRSVLSLGVVNNPCVVQQEASFTFMEATTDVSNTIEPLPFGTPNDLAILAGDLPPFDSIQNVDPPPAVGRYPSFLNAIFDHDWVDFGPDKIAGNADDNNGPLPPLEPRFRSVASAPLRTIGNVWLLRQDLVFEPGTRLPNLPAFDESIGYPVVTVLQRTSAAGAAGPVAPMIVTDFCSPLEETTVSYGTTADHPATAADEAGIPLRSLPEAGAAVSHVSLSFSQRDADNDGIDNVLDPCPFHVDTVWDPRYDRDVNQPLPGDGDVFLGRAIGDGIPDTCDPTPLALTHEPGGQPTDHDGDGFANSGDNCPLHFNPDQKDGDHNDSAEHVGDGIGDACDTPGTETGSDCVFRNCAGSTPRPIPGPRSVPGSGLNVPDGAFITCVRTASITVSGSGEAAVTDPCAGSLPSQETPAPTPTTAPSVTPTATPTATPASAGSPTPPLASNTVTPTLGGLAPAFATPNVTPTVLAAALPPTGGRDGTPGDVLFVTLSVSAGLSLMAIAFGRLRFVRRRR